MQILPLGSLILIREATKESENCTIYRYLALATILNSLINLSFIIFRIIWEQYFCFTYEETKADVKKKFAKVITTNGRARI